MLFISSAFCPTRIGFPSVPLPRTGTTVLHLLPQVTFPCSSSIQQLQYYTSHIGREVKIAIASWLKPMEKMMFQKIIQHRSTSPGVQIMNLQQESINVNKDHFVVILADEKNPCPITYDDGQETDYIGSNTELSISRENITGIMEGDVFDITNKTLWTSSKKIFSLSFVLRIQQTNIIDGMFSSFFLQLKSN